MLFHGGLPEQLLISNYIYILFSSIAYVFHLIKRFCSQKKMAVLFSFFSKLRIFQNFLYSLHHLGLGHISGYLRMVAFQSYFILSIGSIP